MRFNVSSIGDYYFCPRKFYLNKKMGFELFENSFEDNISGLLDELKSRDFSSPESKFVLDATKSILSEFGISFEDTSAFSMSFGRMFERDFIGNVLSGRIDELLVIGGRAFPIKFRFSKSTSENIWQSDKMEMLGYAYLLNKTFVVDKTFLFLLDKRRVFPINFNSISETQIENLFLRMIKTMKGNLPRIHANSRKCDSCSIKKECYHLDNL